METNNLTHNSIDLPQFIGKLKKMDRTASILYSIVKVLYIIFIVAFILGIIALGILNSDFFSPTIMSALLTLVGLVLVFIYLNYRGKDYKNVDYSQTTYEMLKKTSERYKPFLKKDLWMLPGLILMGVGLGLDPSRGNFWNYQLFFWSFTIIGGGGFGLIYWYFKWKPIKDNADKLIKEIES